MRSIKQILLTVAACSLLTVGCATAADNKAEWTVLFDGTSTDAFRGYKLDHFPTNCWKVEDGALTTFRGGSVHADLITKEKYASFELECEWKISEGGNSGIIYRVAEDYDHSYQTGPEMQVLDDSKNGDGKNAKTSAGALYALIAPVNKTLKPVGEWNKVRLLIKGNHVEHWLNGAKIVEYEWGSDDLKELIAKSKFAKWKDFATKDKGHIAFQFHGDVVSFKNIRIRRL